MIGQRKNLLSYLEDLKELGSAELFRWQEGVRWRSRSYAEVHDGALAVASLLIDAGVAPGETVILQGPETADWVEALFGVFRARAVAVPLSPDAPADFRYRVAKKAEAKWFIAPDAIESPAGCRRIVTGRWPRRPNASLPDSEPRLDDRAEIIFTSGTTGEPKGVILTHGNLIADFAPIERQFARYRRYVRFGGPTRVLVTVPLSHMFGQAVAIFLLPFMGCSVVLTPPRPLEVTAAARRHNAWALVTVPRVLDLVAQAVCRELRDRTRTDVMARARAVDAWPLPIRAAAAWRVHRLFGWRFWALVSGGAPLGREVRTLWERFGFLVSEGYGLTETAPIVSVSNPFSRAAGVGRPLSDQEVRIETDGEILVRGNNVTPGYLGDADNARFVDGWFRTGDVGAFDADGRLVIKGRLADVIVTPEGENVFPADVEQVLRSIDGVRDACVVGVPGHAGDEVHAALVLSHSAGAVTAIEQANRVLQPKQRIRSHTIWCDTDFPRTSTGKIQTSIVRTSVLQKRTESVPETHVSAALDDQLRHIVAEHGRVEARSIDDTTVLTDALGLGSLDLVELAIAIEDRLGVSLGHELSIHSTFADLRDRVAAARSPLGQPIRMAAPTTNAASARDAVAGDAVRNGALKKHGWTGSLRMPRWAARFPARQVRQLMERTVMARLVHKYAKPRVEGGHHVESVPPPLLLVSNHRSHVDAAVIKTCLPRTLAARIAPGMTTRLERVAFGEETGTLKRYVAEWIESRLIQLLFHAWPIPRTAGFRHSLLYAGELADSGFSLLLFPEGRHVPAGVMGPFREGTGILARELRLPIVPVYLEGSDQVIREGEPWYRFHYGEVRVTFGAAFAVDSSHSPEEITRRIEAAVLALAPSTVQIDPRLPPEEWMDRVATAQT